MHCPRCGTKNKKGAKFCKKCGQPLKTKGQKLPRQKNIYKYILFLITVVVATGIFVLFSNRSKLAEISLFKNQHPTEWVSWNTPEGTADQETKEPIKKGVLENAVDEEEPLATTEIITLPNVDSENVGFVSHIGGDTKAIAIKGDYTFIGKGPRLLILDTSDPASPAEVGKSTVLSGVVRAVSIIDNHAYVVSRASTRFLGGLSILDISNPAHIRQVGHLETKWPSEVMDFELQGKYAFVATVTTLEVIDVSDPSQPYRIGSVHVGQGEKRNVSGITVSGNYAYVAAQRAGLRIIDVSTPTSMEEVGSLEISPDEWGFGGWMNDVEIQGKSAFISAGDDGMLVIDVSSPSNPLQVSSLEFLGSAIDVEIYNDFAYIPIWYGGQAQESYLSIVDISTPSNVNEIWKSKLFAATNWDSVVTDGSQACILDRDYGILIFDISEPQDSHIVGKYKTYERISGANDIAMLDDLAYIVERYSYGFYDKGALRIIDISTPSQPIEEGFYITRHKANAVDIVEKYAFVATTNGLEVLDVSTPSEINEVGSLYLAGEATNVMARADIAYIPIDKSDTSSKEKGLHVIDISTPTAPKEIGFVKLPRAGSYGYGDMAIVGDILYVADQSLWIIDISSPATPKVVDHYQNWIVTAITADGEYAYFGDYLVGEVMIMDISTPTEPKKISGFGGRMGAPPIDEVYTQGNYAYIAKANSIRVLNVSTPASPTEVGFFMNPGRAEDVKVVGNYIYIASGDAGFLVLSFADGDESTNSKRPTEEAKSIETVTVEIEKTASVDEPTRTSTPFSCLGAPNTRLQDTDYAHISYKPPLPNKVRRKPGTNYSVLGQAQPGDVLKIIGGPKCRDGYVWWKVTVENSGLTGWTAEGDNQHYWLVPCENKESCGNR